MNRQQSTPSFDSLGRIVGYLILLVMSVTGLWVIASTLRNGHLDVNTTQHVPWGLWVVLYIFFLGLSTGSFLLSTLVYVFGFKRLEPAGPLALIQALGCLIVGGVLIVLDLGHPARAYQVLTSMNPTSVMAWMGVFYNLYIGIVLAEIYFALRPHIVRRSMAPGVFSWWYRLLSLGSRRLDAPSLARDRKWLLILGILGIPIAILVTGGAGSIFAVAKARPGWFSGLFPIIFLVSALASGGALLAFLNSLLSSLPRPHKLELVRTLMRLTVGIVGIDLLLFASEILVTFYGGRPHEVTGWKLTLFGPYWWVFWFVQLLAGALVPAAMVVIRRTNGSVRWLGAAGLLVVIGLVGARLNIVIPPQIDPVFATLAEAYHHPRFALGYFPSASEWLVGLGVVSLGIWLFFLARRVLPLEEAEQAATGQSPSLGGGQS